MHLQGKSGEIKIAMVKLILAFPTFRVFYSVSWLFSQYMERWGSVA